MHLAFDLGTTKIIPDEADDKCPICGSQQYDGRCCSHCWGCRCSVCGAPIYRGESWQWNTRGKMHLRCVEGPRSRPVIGTRDEQTRPLHQK